MIRYCTCRLLVQPFNQSTFITARRLQIDATRAFELQQALQIFVAFYLETSSAAADGASRPHCLQGWLGQVACLNRRDIPGRAPQTLQQSTSCIVTKQGADSGERQKLSHYALRCQTSDAEMPQMNQHQTSLECNSLQSTLA